LSRGEALRKGALAAGALYAVGLAGPTLGRVLASSSDDVAILNYLLKFELLEVSLFQGGQRRLRASRELKEMLEELEAEEHRHVEALAAKVEELGGKPTEHVDHAFGYRHSYISVFLRLASELEERVIAAYNGAIPSIESADASALAGSIVQIEGRHAARVLGEAGRNPVPHAFDPAHSEYDALQSVERFVGPSVYE